MENVLIPAVTPKPRHTVLPLLVALFLISYILLTTLVVLQNQTIASQRGLIHLLFKDNLHLAAMKTRLHQNPAARSNQVQGPTSVLKQAPSAQIPSTQIPSTQAPSKHNPSAQAQTPSNQVSATATPSVQVPVIQATPQVGAKSGRSSRKAQKTSPVIPPVEITDPSDRRRVFISI
jgi:hypothetical protein